MANRTGVRRSSSASLIAFVESFAHFADIETGFVMSPFVLSPPTTESYLTRKPSEKAPNAPRHHRSASSFSDPAPHTGHSKRRSLLLAECRSAPHSPRVLPVQTSPPSVALPPIPATPTRQQKQPDPSSVAYPRDVEQEGDDENEITSSSTHFGALIEITPTRQTRTTPVLTTLEAIQALAQSDPGLLDSSTLDLDGDVGRQYSEIQALRAALSYTLSRSETLAASLATAEEEKAAALNELTILRANVVSVLGKAVISPPQISNAPQVPEIEAERGIRAELPTQDDNKMPLPKAPRALGADPQNICNLAESDCEIPPLTPPKPQPPVGGVSISSLRNASAPSVKVASSAGSSFQTESRTEDFSDEDISFDILRVVPNNKVEVSISDFLNASRMSPSEIQEHDARLLSPHTSRDQVRRQPSSISVGLDAPLGFTASGETSTPRIGKFLRGVSKKVETERQRLRSATSNRRLNTFGLGGGSNSSRTSLLGNTSISSNRRKNSISSTMAPSIVASHATAQVAEEDRRLSKSSASFHSAFSEGPATTRSSARNALLMQDSIIPVQYIRRPRVANDVASASS